MKLDDVEIEKVPVPDRRTKIEKPWCDMQPGDSFFVAFTSADAEARFKQKRALTAKAAKKFGTGNYSIRAVEHEGEAGLRVWRRA